MDPKILKRVQDLIARRDNTDSPAEAENAAMRLQEFLLKYNLDETQVKDGLNARTVSIGESKIPLDELGNIKEGQWLSYLYNTIAHHNLCKVVHTPIRGKSLGIVTLMGTPLNIELVDYTVKQLMVKIKAANKHAYATSKVTASFNPNPNAFKRAFYDGCVRGIHAKLKEQTNQIIEQNPGMQGLILSSGQEIAEYVANKFGRLRKKAVSNYGDKSASNMGYEAGKGMNINKGVGAGSQTGPKLLR